MRSGVAERPLPDMREYRAHLSRFVFQSILLMRPMYERARQDLKRLAYADGEDVTVLRAVQTVLDDGLAHPILIGRPRVIAKRVQDLGLRFDPERDIEIVNPEADERYREYSAIYHNLMKRDGVTPQDARDVLRSNTTVIAALLVRQGDADAMLCGLAGAYLDHLTHIREILGTTHGQSYMAAMNVMVRQ